MMLDNLVVDGYEKSLFVIKPDSFQYKNEILGELRNSGLELQYVRDVILKKEFLEKLYGNEKDEFIKLMNVAYLSGKKSTIGIVLGRESRNKLVKICGHKYIPDLCDKDTIRYKYSTKREPLDIRGYKFYINAIHRSMPEDAEREIEIYMEEYIRKTNEEVKDETR